jgi:chromosome segregation ATPase
LPNRLPPRMVESMKGKTGIVVLVALCIALGVGLLVRHSRALNEREAAQASMLQLSNRLVKVEGDLNEQKAVNVTLETNLAVRGSEVESYSNKLVTTSTTLAKTAAEAKAAAEAARDEIARRDAKIAGLEGENDVLTKQMGDLNTAIAGHAKKTG